MTPVQDRLPQGSVTGHQPPLKLQSLAIADLGGLTGTWSGRTGTSGAVCS